MLYLIGYEHIGLVLRLDQGRHVGDGGVLLPFSGSKPAKDLPLLVVGKVVEGGTSQCTAVVEPQTNDGLPGSILHPELVCIPLYYEVVGPVSS